MIMNDLTMPEPRTKKELELYNQIVDKHKELEKRGIFTDFI